MRRHRPIMNAIKNPCSCSNPSVPVQRMPMLQPVRNASVSRISAPPAPARVAAWQPSSPYWQAGLMTAAALSAGAVPQCPGGTVPRAWGQNWYCVPQGYAAPSRPTQPFHPPFVGASCPAGYIREGGVCYPKYM